MIILMMFCMALVGCPPNGGGTGDPTPITLSFNKAKGFNSDVQAIAPATDGAGDISGGGFFNTYSTTVVDRIAKLGNTGTLK